LLMLLLCLGAATKLRFQMRSFAVCTQQQCQRTSPRVAFYNFCRYTRGLLRVL
jgi:hypothetical protein